MRERKEARSNLESLLQALSLEDLARDTDPDAACTEMAVTLPDLTLVLDGSELQPHLPVGPCGVRAEVLAAYHKMGFPEILESTVVGQVPGH